MPTYEYRCPNGHEFEEFQRMSEPPVAKCPVCGADAVRQLSGGAGLLFKGSGFYITDYRSESYKKAAAADQGGSSSSDSASGKSDKSSGKAEGKAEGKSSGSSSSSDSSSSSGGSSSSSGSSGAGPGPNKQ